MNDQYTEYSQEFIEKLNTPPKENEVNILAFLKKNKFFVILLGAALLLFFVIILFNSLNSARRQSIKNYRELSDIVEQTHQTGTKNQNLIDNVNIRVQNSNLTLTLSTLKYDIDEYKKNLTKEELKSIKKHKTKKQSQILERLKKAELNESLDRIYIQEIILLIEEINSGINKIIESKHFKKDFKTRLRQHQDSLKRIKQAASQVEVESTT